MLLGTLDYCFKWEWDDKSKIRGRQKLAAVIPFAVSSTFFLSNQKDPFISSPFPSYYYCSRDIAVATITASKLVMIALVVVSLTACRRVTYDLKVCSCLNENMIIITLTSVYHCHYVLWSQVIVFDFANNILLRIVSGCVRSCIPVGYSPWWI